MTDREAGVHRVLVLGAGFAGLAVACEAAGRGLEVTATSRSLERANALREAHPALAVEHLARLDANVARLVGTGTHVIVTFPPDGATDARVAPHLAHARALTYLSTVGVYDDHTGHLDDTTPLPATPSPRATARLAAEQRWREAGATVLRCPAIYGADRGVHVRLAQRTFRVPGDGSRATSRLHVEDLAALTLAAAAFRADTFVVGDEHPTTHDEVVRWVCAQRGLPHPGYVPLEEVHPTLRADRRVDASRALRELRVTLRFPSYREGMRA
ncbi:MAG: hypothetical protein IPF92_05205 [Myxococcales bacterium]|nr:hypothetical protein [Myxococcales bacterium]